MMRPRPRTGRALAPAPPESTLVLMLLFALVAQLSAQLRTFPSRAADSPRVRLAAEGNSSHFDVALTNILIPRVVGTPNHEKVNKYIKDEMSRLGWDVQTDTFEDNTPVFGRLRFENIIARLNPQASQVMVLSCHYDSKYFKDFEFLAASDSAVPCAMLVNLAQALQRNLTPLKTADLSLEMWFFDGEEAFHKWGPQDSLYGARHLAAKMEKDNTLRRIKLLVLLDLLGTPEPYFFNYYQASEQAYRLLASSEQTLGARNHLKAVGPMNGFRGRRNNYFHQMSYPRLVEDDHTPFLRRGVPVLHIIPAEFPAVWHTQNDNWSALDRHTIDDLNMILRLYTLKYFNL